MAVKIVAELSANHNHDLAIAKESIRVAKACGADAIKLQTYTPDTLTIDCDNEHFRLTQGTIWDGVTLYQLYQTAYTPWEWHEALFCYAKEVGIELFSTPFDPTAVALLEDLQNPIYKIASFEIADLALIRCAAETKKPMVLSVGIATLEEIDDAVQTCRAVGNHDITLLQCTSQYPAKVEDARLANLPFLKERFGVKVGLSDHTAGDEVACLAVAMGATMIEKHFIIDRQIGGPDAAFSMTAEEFSALVQRVRRTEQMVATPDFTQTAEKKKARVFARSLFVVADVKQGEPFTAENIRSIRPGNGMAPKYIDKVIGKTARVDIARGTPLSTTLIAEDIGVTP